MNKGQREERKEGREEIAGNLLNDVLSLEKISGFTGLPIAEIRRLQKKSK